MSLQQVYIKMSFWNDHIFVFTDRDESNDSFAIYDPYLILGLVLSLLSVIIYLQRNLLQYCVL